MLSHDKHVCNIFPQGEKLGLNWKKEQDSLTEAFTRASRRVRKLLVYIEQQYAHMYAEHRYQQLRWAERLPDSHRVKTPRTPFLSKMLRTSIWPDMPLTKAEQAKEGGCLPVDRRLRNGLRVDRPEDGPWTITIDRSIAMQLEMVCWKEFEAIEMWIRSWLEWWSIRDDTTFEYHENYRSEWVEKAREGLAKWFDLVFNSIPEAWHDAVLEQTYTIDVDEDGWTQGPRCRSSLSGSHLPSSNVTGTTSHNSTETNALGAPADFEEWVLVKGSM